MPSMKDIRTRISSVKNTQQITKAMKMVSAAKLNKAQYAITSQRPYAKKLLSLIAHLAQSSNVIHPLLDFSQEQKKILLVVITSDRGLCGGFNTNVNRFSEQFIETKKDLYEKIDLFLIGKKSIDYFKRRNIEFVNSAKDLAKNVSYEYAADHAKNLMNFYMAGDYDGVHFIYNQFKSILSQNRVSEQLFPIDISDEQIDSEILSSNEYLFEPSLEEMLEALLRKHFEVQVYRCFCESIASEHASRMTAMDSATNNAKDMIDMLTLNYNKLRQANITKELTEICSGADALA